MIAREGPRSSDTTLRRGAFVAAVALAAAVLWWQLGMQLTAGVLISLAPVIAAVWLIGRRRLNRLQWVVVAVLAAVAGVVLIFANVVVGCSATTGFGGAACWWDSIPWVIRDIIRSVWSALTGQPMTRDLLPF